MEGKGKEDKCCACEGSWGARGSVEEGYVGGECLKGAVYAGEGVGQEEEDSYCYGFSGDEVSRVGELARRTRVVITARMKARRNKR